MAHCGAILGLGIIGRHVLCLKETASAHGDQWAELGGPGCASGWPWGLCVAGGAAPVRLPVSSEGPAWGALPGPAHGAAQQRLRLELDGGGARQGQALGRARSWGTFSRKAERRTDGQGGTEAPPAHTAWLCSLRRSRQASGTREHIRAAGRRPLLAAARDRTLPFLLAEPQSPQTVVGHCTPRRAQGPPRPPR